MSDTKFYYTVYCALIDGNLVFKRRATSFVLPSLAIHEHILLIMFLQDDYFSEMIAHVQAKMSMDNLIF